MVDEWITISESEIASAVRDVFRQHKKVIEGAAGVALAAYMKDVKWRTENPDAPSVIVACGANISPAVLLTLLA